MAWCGVTCFYLAEKRRWTTEDGLGTVGAFGAGGVADTGAGAAAVEGAAKADMVANVWTWQGTIEQQWLCAEHSVSQQPNKPFSTTERELME